MIRFITKILLFSFLLVGSEGALANNATPYGPPLPPTSVTATLVNPSSTTSTDIRVQWSGADAQGSTITGYQVTPYVGPDFTQPATVSCSGPGSSDSCTVSGLAFGTSYKFAVTVKSVAGEATSSLSTNAITTNSQGQTVTIDQNSVPSTYRFGDPAFQLSASATSGLTVSWTVPSTSDVCSVDLSGTVTFLKSGSCTIWANQDGSGSSFASASDSVTVTSTISLSATLGSATSVQSSQATLNGIVPYPGADVTPTFCVSTTNSVTSCSLPSGVSIGNYTPAKITASSGTSVSAVVSGLQQNTTYYFWLTVSATGATSSSTSTGNFKTVSGPSISYSGETSGTVGSSISGTLTASSGSGVYAAWSASSLPTGVTFNPGITPTTSSISGTPTTAGTFVALYTVTDSSGLESQLNVTYRIAEKPAPANSNTNTTDTSTAQSSTTSVLNEIPSGTGTGGTGATSGGSTGSDSSAGGNTGTSGTGAGSEGSSSGSGNSSIPTKPANPYAAIDYGSLGTAASGGGSYLFNDGIGEKVSVSTIEEKTGLKFLSNDWYLSVRSTSRLVQDQSGEADRRVATELRGNLITKGGGYKPNSQVDIYVHSDPIWIGGVTTNRLGEFTLELNLPSTVLAGEHVFQVVGVGLKSQPLVANIPLLVLARGADSVFLPTSVITRTVDGPIRTFILVGDVPLRSQLSWKTPITKNTRGVQTATITRRGITITPKSNFSGVILLPLEVKSQGVTVSRSVALTVKPQLPLSPRHSVNGINETLISWNRSINALRYVVTLNEKIVCETKVNSCSYKGLAGPASRFGIRALGEDGTESNLILSKFIQSKPRLLAMINFANNSSALDSRELAKLNDLVEVIVREGFTSMSIIGYTDSVGKRAANQRLSEARAKAVYDFITGNVVGAVRAIGKGKGRPIKSNATTEGRAANRRVEIYIG